MLIHDFVQSAPRPKGRATFQNPIQYNKWVNKKLGYEIVVLGVYYYWIKESWQVYVKYCVTKGGTERTWHITKFLEAFRPKGRKIKLKSRRVEQLLIEIHALNKG